MADFDEPNSKVIVIRRTNNGSPVDPTGNPQLELWLENSICAFGVRYESGTKTNTWTGLSRKQENVLLPLVADIDVVTDHNVLVATKIKADYYSKLKAFVPFKSGLSLQIGLTRSNEEPMDIDNLPINPDQYAKYKALFEKNPEVAKNREEGMSQRHFRAYIEDGELLQTQAEKLQDAKHDAMNNYFSIKDSVSALRKFIVLMTGKRLHRDENDAKKLSIKLSALYEANPVRFNELYADKDSDKEYLLTLLVSYDLIEIKIGGTYWDTQSRDKIVDSKKDMIMWLKDNANENEIAIYKKLLAEKQSQEPKPKPY